MSTQHPTDPQQPHASPAGDGNLQGVPRLGGVVHTYLGYDPKSFPSPTAPPPDLASAAMEHMLAYGSTRRLTDEELARAVRIDPSQIAGLGPSLDGLIAMLEERRRKILETYEVETVAEKAARRVETLGKSLRPPREMKDEYEKVLRSRQVRDLERLFFRIKDDRDPFAIGLVGVAAALGDTYQIEQLGAKWTFTGRTALTIEEAVAIKEELEEIEKLLEQLREAAKTAQLGVIDLEALSEYAQQGDIDRLQELSRAVAEYLRAQAEAQGLEQGPDGYRLTPEAYRIFQGKVLTEIFQSLQASRSGRHSGQVEGDGPVELSRTRPYEFGDSLASMDVTQSLLNAAARRGHADPGARSSREPAWETRDIEVHLTRNNPRCATCVLIDMSGSMRFDGQYINAKRMALALDGLIRREYPGDWVGFIEVYSLAKRRTLSEVVALLPRPVTIRQPVVRLRADMSDPKMSEAVLPPHFTNIQRGLALARQLLAVQDTPNRQVMLITDGLPTAHFEGSELFLLYPPDPRTEEATMREAVLCAREGITINTFLVPNWSQSSEDIRFAHRLGEATRGRVFFTGGGDLDRFVLWDYVSNRRRIIG